MRVAERSSGRDAIRIGVWLQERRATYEDVCGLIPEVGLPSFWQALGVHEGYAKRVARELAGEAGVFAPRFPVLSELSQMYIDVSWIDAKEIPALILELERGRTACQDPWGQAVFDGLQKCATLALAECDGIWLLPCW